MEENAIQIKNGIMINVTSSAKNIWNPATCSCENGKCLTNIIEDLVMTCDKIMDADAEAKLYDQDKRIKTVRY